MTAAGIARLQDGRVTPENVRPRARAAYRRKQRQRARCRLQRFRRPAGTGEEGMGESPVPVQAPRTVAVTGCGEGVNVVQFQRS